MLPGEWSEKFEFRNRPKDYKRWSTSAEENGASLAPRPREVLTQSRWQARRRAAEGSTLQVKVGCISWDATSGGWPLRVRKFRVEYDWNHAKFVWTCGADVRGRPTLVICFVDRCAGACLQAKAGLGDTTWRHLTDSFFSFSFLLDFGGSSSGRRFPRSWWRSLFGDRRLLA